MVSRAWVLLGQRGLSGVVIVNHWSSWNNKQDWGRIMNGDRNERKELLDQG